MDKYIRIATLVASVSFAASAAWAKLPPPPPEDPAKKAAADEKKKATAEKEKAELATAEERAVKNYQDNMRKMGKPVPKPQPVMAQSAPSKGGQPSPQGNTAKVDQQGKQEAAKQADKSGKK